LQLTGIWLQNGAVRASARCAVTTMVILCACLCSPARNQDRDRSGASSISAHPPAPEARVDINHASIDELMKVPGMTETWAARIVRFRPYRTKQDLLDKGVVTSQVYDRIKDSVIAHKEKQ
jgi:DNA uptake protein ComE-like DNA-binding protein